MAPRHKLKTSKDPYHGWRIIRIERAPKMAPAKPKPKAKPEPSLSDRLRLAAACVDKGDHESAQTLALKVVLELMKAPWDMARHE